MNEIYFFDTDCLSSFLINDYESILISLYAGNIYLTSYVYLEACRNEKNKLKIKELEKDGHIKKITINYGTKEHKAFNKLTDTIRNSCWIGDGEASAIAMCKVRGGVLASNNFKDILKYVKEYNLKNTTTSDILVQAVNKKLISTKDANVAWNKMLTNGLYLPFSTFDEYYNSKM